MNELSDEYLTEMATKLAVKYVGRLGSEAPFSPFSAYMDSSRERLKDARESLRLLEEARLAMANNEVYGYAKGISDHITHLRKLLGVDQ